MKNADHPKLNHLDNHYIQYQSKKQMEHWGATQQEWHLYCLALDRILTSATGKPR